MFLTGLQGPEQRTFDSAVKSVVKDDEETIYIRSKLSDEETRYISMMAYVNEEIRARKKSVFAIEADAAKFLTTSPAKRFPSMTRPVLKSFVLMANDPNFEEWKEMISEKIADRKLRAKYFNTKNPKSIANRVDQIKQWAEVELMASRERLPIAPAAIAAQELKVHSVTQQSPVHDEGSNNEDTGLSPVMTDGTVFSLLGDGIGGHGHGDQASRLVALAFQTAMVEFWLQHSNEPAVLSDVNAIREAMENAVLFARQKLDSTFALQNTKAGATLLALTAVPLGDGNYQAVLVNIGDSRAYLIRPGKPLLNLTIDNLKSAVVFSLRAMVRLARKNLPFRFLESFLGYAHLILDAELKTAWEKRFKLETSITEGDGKPQQMSWVAFKARPGDSVLKFTDGLEPMTIAEIARIRFSAANADQGLERLVKTAQPLNIYERGAERRKPDDAWAQEVGFGKFSALEPTLNSHVIALYRELKQVAELIFRGDLETAQTNLNQVKKDAATIPSQLQSACGYRKPKQAGSVISGHHQCNAGLF